jgi:hypothetical protein
MNHLQLPLIPKPGEVWLTLELTAISQSIDEALIILKDLGYEPELRYRQSDRLRLFALLKHEHDVPSQVLRNDYLGDHMDRLAEIFEPSAIASPRGHAAPVAVAA